MELSVSLGLIFQLFVLLNPLASAPFLMSAYRQNLNVKSIAIKAVLTAFIIAVVITFSGKYLFELFGISLDSFRIAGGLILLLLGIQMVMPPSHKTGEGEITGVQSTITIIATPLLTGPATISFITLKAMEVGQFATFVNLIGAFILVAAVFIFLSVLVSKINTQIIDMISRILGLFLTAVAIEMIAKGTQELVFMSIKLF